MQIEYGVQPFDPELKAAYARLLPQQTEANARGKLDWKFLDHPHAKGVVAVARDRDAGDSVIGMVGFAPTRLKLGDERKVGYQALDTVVDPAYRGKGLFTGLGRAFYAAQGTHGGDVLWGFPNENAAPGWYGKLGWAHLGTAPFLFRPLRTGYFFGKVAKLLAGVDLPLAGARPPVSADRIRPVERFDGRADMLWARFSDALGCAVDRDSDYLNWRLFRHPAAAYETTAMHGANGSLRAFATAHSADKHGGRVAYVMEAMAEPGAEDDLVLLLRAQAAEMARRRMDVALAWCAPHAPNYAAYRRAGFLPLPQRLRPTPIYFGSRALDATLGPVVEDVSRWYLSYLDSDTV